MLDPKDYKLLFKVKADDGSIVLLTKDQIDYIRVMQFLRHKKKEAIEQKRHQKLMNKTKRRRLFNPQLN